MRGVFDFLRFAVCQVFDFLLREDDGTRSQAQDVEAQEVLWEIAGPFGMFVLTSSECSEWPVATANTVHIDILIEILTRPGRILPVSRGNILMQSFIFLSLALGLGSLALAALISKVVTDNIVLLRDPNCAYWEVVPNGTRQIDEILMRNSTEGPTVSELAEYSYLLPQLSAVVRNGSETSYFYRQVCGGEISGPACKTLLMDPLPQTRIHGQKCPFMPDQCVGGDNSAYTIDTGNISIAHFGVNQRTSLKFRRITTCAPLNITSYAVSDRGDFSFVKHWGVNITHSIRNDTAAAYVNNTKCSIWCGTCSNSTNRYAVTAIPPRVGREVHPNLQPTGQLTGQPPTGQPSGVGNISIVVISRNDLPHLHRNEDDIFKANDRKEIVPNFPMFFPKWEDRLSAIGCVEKQILCTDTACSREVGVLRNAEGLTGLDDFNRTLSEVDQGIIGLMYPHFTVGQTIADAARGLGNRLVASQNLISLPTQSGRIVELQTTLSEDQWKAEVDACECAFSYFPSTSYRGSA